MSRQGAQWDDWEQDKGHKARVIKKLERIQGLQALHQTWEADPKCDHKYLLKLRAKIRNAQNQLDAMAV